MKFATLIAAVIVHLSLDVFGAGGVKWQINEEVNSCKRNDPQFQKCFCDNFNHLIPVIKDGISEMNIDPIDPARVEHIRMDLTKVSNIYIQAELSNVTLHGMSLGSAPQCNPYITKDGFQLRIQLVFPEIAIESKYKADGKFMLLVIQARGDCVGKFSGLVVNTLWNSTRYMKHGKEHLKFTAKIDDIKVEKMDIRFNNLFGNNTEINENLNDFIKTNIDLLYDDIKPVILEVVREISLKLINDLYDVFPYNVLFPPN